MSSLRRRVRATRRPSMMLAIPSSTTSEHSTASRPSSPSMFSRVSSRMRNFYDGTFNETAPSFDMPTPSYLSVPLTPVGPPCRPQISRLAESFADGITTFQLSDFLIWFLYYDVVELPDSPKAWYAPLTSPDTRGWIAIGTFLAQTQAVGAEYGLDLVVMDSICDRQNLHHSLLHEILIKFACPKKMAYGILANTVRRAEQASMTKLPMLVEVQAKLNAMNQLAAHLKPTPDSHFAAWQPATLKRIRSLLHLVIGPRIVHITDGTPLLTAATSQSLPKEALDGIKLNYLFEVVQLERRVPLARYGSHDLDEPDFLSLTSEQASNVVLRRENEQLKEKVTSLVKEKQELEVKNRELGARLECAMAVWDGYLDVTTQQSGALSVKSVHSDSAPSIASASSSSASLERHLSQDMDTLLPDHVDLRRQRRSGFIQLDGLHDLNSESAQAYVTEGETFIICERQDRAAEMLDQGTWSDLDV